jgi:ribonuclease P/MRP protein subunit RPP40
MDDSTTHALIAITHQWYQSLDDRNSVRAVFIDFRKAFDRIDHSTILTRIVALGIHQSAIRWMHSFLSNRQQRVNIGPVFSEWKFLTDGMPQGTWFGQYAFIIMIDTLRTINDTYKFVDDVTLTEVITPSADSQMQLAVNQVVAWSQSNFMNINTKKTKEMLLGSVTYHPLTNKGIVKQVTSFKLLGVVITNNLLWEQHVTTICAKVNKRLNLSKLLKRAGVTTADLLQYYESVIRPVVEYACPVRQSGLTIAQRDRLESLQRHAIKMITNSNDYELQCALYGIQLIGVRLDSLARSIFNRIRNNHDCLHYLIPNQRSIDLLCIGCDNRILFLTSCTELNGFQSRSCHML